MIEHGVLIYCIGKVCILFNVFLYIVFFFAFSNRVDNTTQTQLQEHHLPDALSCYELRHFWIRLTEDNRWQLGQGHPDYENPIINYQDPDMLPVQGAAFCSYTRNGGVQYHDWEYDQYTGKCG